MSIDKEVYEYLAIPCITTDITNNDVDYPLLRWIFTAHDALLVPPVLTSIESDTHYSDFVSLLRPSGLYFPTSKGTRCQVGRGCEKDGKSRDHRFLGPELFRTSHVLVSRYLVMYSWVSLQEYPNGSD